MWHWYWYRGLIHLVAASCHKHHLAPFLLVQVSPLRNVRPHLEPWITIIVWMVAISTKSPKPMTDHQQRDDLQHIQCRGHLRVTIFSQIVKWLTSEILTSLVAPPLGLTPLGKGYSMSCLLDILTSKGWGYECAATIYNFILNQVYEYHFISLSQNRLKLKNSPIIWLILFRSKSISDNTNKMD